jgi:hypothetical protein
MGCSAKCFECHGPDAEARKADLRFDDGETACAPWPCGGMAIVPGRLVAMGLFPDEHDLCLASRR